MKHTSVLALNWMDLELICSNVSAAYSVLLKKEEKKGDAIDLPF